MIKTHYREGKEHSVDTFDFVSVISLRSCKQHTEIGEKREKLRIPDLVAIKLTIALSGKSKF